MTRTVAPDDERAEMTTDPTDASARLDKLALCLRLHATLARASALLRLDLERAGRLLEVARAAVEQPGLPLAPRLARELRRLLDEAARSSAAGDISSAESSTALAEALCLAGMLRRETTPGGEGERA